MPHDLLLEIGCEELPSSFVAGALAALPGIVTKKLDALRVAHGEARAFGSPRRIALVVESIGDRQPDVEEELTGPPAQSAFDAAGKPTKGAEAFAKKLGVEVGALKIVETPKGKYVAGTRREAGRASKELLPKVLVEAMAEIPFRKSMRWGSGDVAFGRPIHWIVALLGGEVLPLSFAGVTSGKKTRGHRFLAPAEIEVGGATEYVGALANVHVFADVAARTKTMVERLDAKAKELGLTLVRDAFLVDENVGLVEEPFVVDGSYDDVFLALPKALVLDVMRTHQRYFGVVDANGKLAAKYLAVVNTAKDPVRIRRGNDNVLRGRLSDARFFVETDRKAGLDACAKKLEGVRYHAKLGTVADKVARMRAFVAKVLEVTDRGDLAKKAARAVDLSKADLTSLTVGEFPEMQGHAGRDFALAAGEDHDVADSIAEHWLESPDVGALGLVIGLADKLDHLAGGFAVGLAPTGANDPFAMRRAFLRATAAYLKSGERLSKKLPSMRALAKLAYDAYGGKLAKSWEAVEPELVAFMKTRLVGLFEANAPKDVVEACIEAEGGIEDLFDLRARIDAVKEARGTPAFARLATAFKRAAKITKDVPIVDPDPSKFDHPSEKALWTAYAEARGVVARATEGGDYRRALEAASAAIADPMDTFFDKDRGVFVMAEDLAVRENRLRMLATIASALRKVARLELLEGSA